MDCPKCFTTWHDDEGFLKHVTAHGVDPWRIKQMQADLKAIKGDSPRHRPYEPCKCRAYGAKFECELTVRGTP